MSVAYFAIFLLVPLILGLLWLLPGVLSPADWTARGFTIGERLLTEGRVIWHYFYWTLVPDIGSMTLYHDAFPVSRGLFSPWTSLLAWAGIAALLAAGIFLGRRRPLVAFGLLWFLVGQTLTASFIPLELVFEHRQYLPSLGLLLVLFSLLLLSGVRLNLRRLLAGAAAALILLYAGSLALRSFQWSNPIRQAVAAARTHPQSPRATYELARMLLILSRHDPQLVQPTRRALNHARQVPGQGIIATAGLVLLANAEHQPLRAEWFAAMTAKLHARPPTPQDVGALDSLVQCAMRQRNPCRLPAGGMKNLFRAALAHKQPDGYVMAIHGNYLLNVLHRPRAAARIFSALVRRAPGNARYHFSLGVCLAFAGDADGARTELATLRRLNRNGAFDHGVRQLEGLIKRLYAEPKSS
ncbi:MAG: hypothetical protein L0I62_09225 [Gammaproteobacteria bacterium]|nr:hypothetical protein [Gammaproteobacteria bacterium]